MPLSIFRAAILASTVIALAGCAASVTPPAIGQEAAQTSSIALKQGQVLQLIAPQSREGAQEARNAYYRDVLPLAESFGFRRLAQLKVERKVVGNSDPGAFILFSWPSESAARAFYTRPELPRFVARRPEGWSELQIFDDVVEQDTTISIDPAKDYSVVLAWFNPENPGDYERYLKGIEPAVTRAGGRFIYKMRQPTLESNVAGPVPPDQITFVEWDAPDGFADLQKTSEYQAHRKYFASGTTRFEFYWLKPTPLRR